jgi:hypothetical protein
MTTLRELMDAPVQGEGLVLLREARARLDRISALLDAHLQAGPAGGLLEVAAEGFFHRCDCGGAGLVLIRDVHVPEGDRGSAPGAHVLLIELEATDALRDLVGAMRAFEADLIRFVGGHESKATTGGATRAPGPSDGGVGGQADDDALGPGAGVTLGEVLR